MHGFLLRLSRPGSSSSGVGRSWANGPSAGPPVSVSRTANLPDPSSGPSWTSGKFLWEEIRSTATLRRRERKFHVLQPATPSIAAFNRPFGSGITAFLPLFAVRLVKLTARSCARPFAQVVIIVWLNMPVLGARGGSPPLGHGSSADPHWASLCVRSSHSRRLDFRRLQIVFAAARALTFQPVSDPPGPWPAGSNVLLSMSRKDRSNRAQRIPFPLSFRASVLTLLVSCVRDLLGADDLPHHGAADLRTRRCPGTTAWRHDCSLPVGFESCGSPLSVDFRPHILRMRLRPPPPRGLWTFWFVALAPGSHSTQSRCCAEP